MIYSQDKQFALLAAYKTDLDKFLGACPVEQFEKHEGELARAWGELQNTYNEALTHIANQPTEAEEKKRKTEHHSLLEL